MKNDFRSFLVKPAQKLAEIIDSPLIANTSGHFPVEEDLPKIKTPRQKRIYLVPIRTYHNLSFSQLPDFLKQYKLQLCQNAPNYLVALPGNLIKYRKEFDDQYIVALNYSGEIIPEFTPINPKKKLHKGILGLWFCENNNVKLLLMGDIYNNFAEGKCYVIAERLHS